MANCPSRILGPCPTTAMSLTRRGRAALCHDYGLFDVLDPANQAHFADVDLLQPASMKLPPALVLLFESCCSTCPMLKP